jgi:hypothetical protein
MSNLLEPPRGLAAEPRGPSSVVTRPVGVTFGATLPDATPP